MTIGRKQVRLRALAPFLWFLAGISVLAGIIFGCMHFLFGIWWILMLIAGVLVALIGIIILVLLVLAVNI